MIDASLQRTNCPIVRFRDAPTTAICLSRTFRPFSLPSVSTCRPRTSSYFRTRLFWGTKSVFLVAQNFRRATWLRTGNRDTEDDHGAGNSLRMSTYGSQKNCGYASCYSNHKRVRLCPASYVKPSKPDCPLQRSENNSRMTMLPGWTNRIDEAYRYEPGS